MTWCEGKGVVVKDAGQLGQPKLDAAEQRKYIRCPVCNRRLHVQIKYHDGGQQGDIDAFVIPGHKRKK